MVVGTILLDENDMYIDNCGGLPARSDFDKELLKTLVSKGSVSVEAFTILPPSIREVAIESYNIIPITIRELAEADMLIVVRSPKLCNGGKRFRLDKFKKFGDGNPQIYIKID